MENKNTFYFDKDVSIVMEPVDFVPESGDVFMSCESKEEAVREYAKVADAVDEYETGRKRYVTNDFDASAAYKSGWCLLRPIALCGDRYGAIGYRSTVLVSACSGPETKTQEGRFFLYKLV